MVKYAASSAEQDINMYYFLFFTVDRLNACVIHFKFNKENSPSLAENITTTTAGAYRINKLESASTRP